MTHSIEIFLAANQAVRQHLLMVPTSRNDKEYFAQNWFIDRLEAVGLPYRQQGRNSYPDFWAGDEQHAPVEGYEVKCLSFAKGKPARKDFDSNSTIPSGRRKDRDVFLVFFLYTGSGPSLRTVHSLCIAHNDLVNADQELAESHTNEAIHGFGSYGDGFIRNRKMYVFPHPFSLQLGAVGRCQLVLPAEWGARHPSLKQVGSIERAMAGQVIRGYSIDLLQPGLAKVETSPNAAAGTVRTFDVFEAVESKR